MLSLEYTSKFHRDMKRMEKRGKSKKKIKKIAYLLITKQKIPEHHRNHKLTGNYKDHWELHIENDWLLIYLKTSKSIIVVRTGSHSDLF